MSRKKRTFSPTVQQLEARQFLTGAPGLDIPIDVQIEDASSSDPPALVTNEFQFTPTQQGPVDDGPVVLKPISVNVKEGESITQYVLPKGYEKYRVSAVFHNPNTSDVATLEHVQGGKDVKITGKKDAGGQTGTYRLTLIRGSDRRFVDVVVTVVKPDTLTVNAVFQGGASTTSGDVNFDDLPLSSDDSPKPSNFLISDDDVDDDDDGDDYFILSSDDSLDPSNYLIFGLSPSAAMNSQESSPTDQDDLGSTRDLQATDEFFAQLGDNGGSL